MSKHYVLESAIIGLFLGDNFWISDCSLITKTDNTPNDGQQRY